jgi:hypothetical protein
MADFLDEPQLSAATAVTYAARITSCRASKKTSG